MKNIWIVFYDNRNRNRIIGPIPYVIVQVDYCGALCSGLSAICHRPRPIYIGNPRFVSDYNVSGGVGL